MHWGTFTLTAEDTIEPRKKLNELTKKFNINNFKTITPGEVITLD